MVSSCPLPVNDALLSDELQPLRVRTGITPKKEEISIPDINVFVFMVGEPLFYLSFLVENMT